MLKLRYSLALAGAIMAAVILSASYASAQQVKKNPVSFAVIDVQLILNTSLAMKNVREQLEVQRKRFQVSIAAEEGKLRIAGQKLARQRGVLAPQALARRGRQLRNRVALFQRRFQAKRREIDQAFAATLREFEKELKAVVAEIARERGYTVVLDRRQTNTHVILKNNQTVMLSGLFTEEESQITRGIPFLMDIPWLGELFNSREYETTRRELIALLTPRVVDTAEENDTNFNVEARRHLQDLNKPLTEQLKDRKEHPERYEAIFMPTMPTADGGELDPWTENRRRDEAKREEEEQPEKEAMEEQP